MVRVPRAFDAEYLGAITDATVGLGALFKACPEAAIRWEMGLFYIAAALWKVNTAFLDPRYSCGTTYAVQLLCALTTGGSKDYLTRVVVAAMPWVTVALEGGIGIAALGHWTKLAVLLCVALHTGIALTPPPNNIAG